MMPILKRVDHLVYATQDLVPTVAELERRLGVRALPGGSHPGRGTRNALIALGPRSYLEVIGPDSEQSAPPAPRWFGIDRLRGPRLVAWAANTTDLSRVAAEGSERGVPLGTIMSGSRLGSDGTALSWRFTDPTKIVEDGIVPFFIDWGASPHPAASATRGVELIAFEAEHPDPLRVQDSLLALGLELQVSYAPRPALVATVQTATAAVQIR
jgi:hypothetical protein